MAATLQRKSSGGIIFVIDTKIITKENVPRNYFVIFSARMVSYQRVFTLICWREHWFLKHCLAISSCGLSASIARAPFCETPILGSNSSHTTPPKIPLVEKRSFGDGVRLAVP